MEKNISFGKILLAIILGLLLTAVLFAGYVFFRMTTTKIEKDDVEKILEAEPLELGERAGVDDEQRLYVRLDKADIYYIINSEYGEDYLEKMIAGLKENGLDIDSYAFSLKEEGMIVDMSGKYKGFKIAASAVLEPSAGTNGIDLKVAKVKVAGMALPASVNKDLQDVSLTLKTDIFLFEKISEVRTEDGYLVIYGDLDPAILDAVDPEKGYDKNFTYYVEDCREVLDAGNVLSEDKEAATKIFIEGITEKGFAKVIDDYFTVAYPGVSNTIMKDETAADRFLYVYKGTDFIEKFRVSSQKADSGKKNMEILTDAVYRYFNLGRISIKDGAFLLDGKDFAYEDLVFEGWEDVYGGLIKGDSFRLVLIDDDAAFKGDVGNLLKHIDDVSSIAEEVDTSKKYTLGYICETSGGLKILAYNVKTSGVIGFASAVFDLDEKDFAKLSDTSKVHVYKAE